MKVKDCIFFQLAKANQAGTRFWSTQVSKHHLTATQAMVMNFLYDCDEVTSSDLGKRTMLDSATLTGILDRLETANFIERKRHPDDRRAIQVCLTKEGRVTASKVYSLVETANVEFMKKLNSEEQTTLKHLLTKIRE